MAVAMNTAQRNIDKLSDWARERITLGNGDRAFSLEDIVTFAERTELPVAFDWHHHWLHHDEGQSDDQFVELLGRAFRLWNDRPPKVHVSSPRSEKQPRIHADYVDVEFIQPFLELLPQVGVESVDVMVEARQNDLALFKLRDELNAQVGIGLA